MINDEYQKNIQPFLQLGGWGGYLYPVTDFAKKEVALFQNANAPFFLPSRNKSGHLYLVLAEHPFPGEIEYPDWLPENQKPIWDKFTKAWEQAYRHYDRMCSLLSVQDIKHPGWFTFSWTEKVFDASVAPSVQPNQTPVHFFCLMTKKLDSEMKRAILIYSLSLAANWHIQERGLCLHSSAVASPRGGIVFLGHSGVGKSTVASISAFLGYDVLGDDLNFVYFNQKYLLAAGPSVMLLPDGYSPRHSPLRRVFVLKQDSHDYLVPLSPVQIAQALFASLSQTPPANKLSNATLTQAFRTIGDISRQIPGYELHFRKSPDFWK
jgi:hypothetical protein